MDSSNSKLGADIPEKVPDKRQISENFHAGDADVTFVSSDNVLFHIHRKNLETHTGGFAAAEFDTRGEVVPLTETAATLELLFQFVYPRRHPDLSSMQFVTLAPLAEAAEKYEVFSAMNICRIRMRDALPDNAVDIFNYAARHDYRDILILAAPLLLDIPLGKIAKKLLPGLIAPWIRYHEAWSRAAFSAINTAPEHYYPSGVELYCLKTRLEGCRLYSHLLPGQLWATLGEKRSREALLGFYKDIPGFTCNANHYNDYSGRRTRLEDALKAVPSFDSFL